MNERDRRARREPPRTGGGARPFAPGEAPLGVRPGLAGQRRRAGVDSSPVSTRRDGPPPVRRGTTRRLSPETVRALRSVAVALLLIGALLAPTALASSGALRIATLRVDGLTLLDEGAVRAASGVVLGDGLLSRDPRRIEQALGEIPFVASSRVRIGLPGEIRAEIREEAPLLRWSSDGVVYLVSGTGAVLGPTTSPLLSDAGRTVIEQLPLIEDLRVGAPQQPGGRLSSLDLDIATRLASLTAGDVGSAATHLSLFVDPQYGFVLRGQGSGFDWNAVFGIYSATIRPPEMLPGQVRLLRSLLAGREGRVGWVILADGQAGTFTAPGVRPPPPPGASGIPSAEPSAAPSESEAAP